MTKTEDLRHQPQVSAAPFHEWQLLQDDPGAVKPEVVKIVLGLVKERFHGGHYERGMSCHVKLWFDMTRQATDNVDERWHDHSLPAGMQVRLYLVHEKDKSPLGALAHYPCCLYVTKPSPHH